MLKKSFSELAAVDVSRYVKKRDGQDYLPWTACKQLLHDQGAEVVWFETVTGDDGSSLIMSQREFTNGGDKNARVNCCYEVRVRIKVDSELFEAQYPVMNGANPVQDNSMNQNRVWAAACRAFVKGVAMRLGLGWSLWLKEDDFQQEEDLSKHDIHKIKERVQMLYTQQLRVGADARNIAEALDMSVDEVKIIFTYFDQLDRFERKLANIRWEEE